VDLPQINIETILYPTDLSENARIAFSYAISLSAKYNAKIKILHVMQEPSDKAVKLIGDDQWMKFRKERSENAKSILIGKRQEAAEIRESLGKFVNKTMNQDGMVPFFADEILLEYGNPAEVILRVSEERKCDLIVMGSRGESGLMGAMLGSTVSRVLKKSGIPILAIRAK